ncbi:MAG TPA: hypothetical protein VIQ54_19465 [Polyangia bacterium]|jgi:hypothetical protein
MRTYRYVGSEEIARQAQAAIERLQPTAPADIRAWSARVKRSALEFTYIVDTGGNLWLSDRRTEHVACARGAQVLGAGEIEIAVGPDRVTVASITNQSTGYCPEPDCWPAVRDALARAGLEPPDGFTYAFRFRRCPTCRGINILKDAMPECPSCGTDLPAAWNLDD